MRRGNELKMKTEKTENERKKAMKRTRHRFCSLTVPEIVLLEEDAIPVGEPRPDIGVDGVLEAVRAEVHTAAEAVGLGGTKGKVVAALVKEPA